jgi:curli production assembly/transport component CsgF
MTHSPHIEIRIMRKSALVLLTTFAVASMGWSAATASEIVYHPVNPSFGGSGLNGSYLLSQAQGQGQGVKSGAQGADLSGLNNALSNLGSGAVIINSPNGSGSGGSNGSGAGGSNPGPQTSAVRSIVP